MAKAKEAPRFEALVDELQALVEKLEGGGLALEEALALYERGVGLTRQANTLLEGTERRVETLQKSLAGEEV